MFGPKSIVASAAATAALVLMPATELQAATCAAGNSSTVASPALDTSDVTIDFMGGVLEATACAGLFDGNDITGSSGPLLGLLNDGLFAGFEDDWDVFGKSDETGSGVTAPETTSGEFSIDFTPDSFSTFVVSLKGADYFAVYLFDLTPDALSTVDGDFTMYGRINQGNQQVFAALSHLGVVTYGDSTVIPVPAGGLLLLSGLAGIGLLRRRRKPA